ncbi:hypothetical protein [uncultured Kriegella sp.]|uniref:hypothetical protein n=1 Tax=uncultured Kriegella sp. TaxID=1798910 RepID=UPI0030DBBB07|tara:strand:- start:7996 stop:8619 length:624 start_codon:yes stop_codon:yes gene_type:complete
MKLATRILTMVISILVLFGCQTKKSKSDIEIAFTRDTLDVGYTYWWPQSGPFIGDCGEELSLVFVGILKQLEKPNKNAGPLYTVQEGIIEIEKVFKIKEVGRDSYANQKFVRTDCFYDLGLQIGDTVSVSCYDFEDAYSIPGGNSILKIRSFDDPIITSLRNYIDSDQNPVKLKKDSLLWRTFELDKDLSHIITCHEQSKDSVDVSK